MRPLYHFESILRPTTAPPLILLEPRIEVYLNELLSKFDGKRSSWVKSFPYILSWWQRHIFSVITSVHKYWYGYILVKPKNEHLIKDFIEISKIRSKGFLIEFSSLGKSRMYTVYSNEPLYHDILIILFTKISSRISAEI